MAQADDEREEKDDGDQAPKPTRNWGRILNISLFASNVILLIVVGFSCYLTISAHTQMQDTAATAQNAYFEAAEVLKAAQETEKHCSGAKKLASDAVSLSSDNKKLAKATLSKLKQGIYCR